MLFRKMVRRIRKTPPEVVITEELIPETQVTSITVSEYVKMYGFPYNIIYPSLQVRQDN